MIAGTIRIEADDRSAVDHLAAVDIEIDLVFAVTNRYGSHLFGHNGCRSGNLAHHRPAPGGIARPTRSGVIMRRGDENVLAHYVRAIGDGPAEVSYHFRGGTDQIERHDGRLRVAIRQEQHSCADRITD